MNRFAPLASRALRVSATLAAATGAMVSAGVAAAGRAPRSSRSEKMRSLALAHTT